MSRRGQTPICVLYTEDGRGGVYRRLLKATGAAAGALKLLAYRAPKAS